MVTLVSRPEYVRVGIFLLRREKDVLSMETVVQHSQWRLLLLVDPLELVMLLPNDLGVNIESPVRINLLTSNS